MSENNKKRRIGEVISDSHRTHSKIKLYDLIIHALDNNSDPAALVWVNRTQGIFAINGTKFTDFYQLKTESSAKWNSIKNRLTKSKTGFYALETSASQMPPTGYHKLYTYVKWPADLSVLLPSISQHTEEKPLIHQIVSIGNLPPPPPLLTEIISLPLPLPIPTPPPIQTEIITSLSPPPTEDVKTIPLLKRELSCEESIPSYFLETYQPDSYNTFQFNALKFLDDMKNIYEGMNDDDIMNFKILLSAEIDSVHDLSNIQTKALHEFGIRYGPWAKIVDVVREFVSDGASEWFIGKCDSHKAAEILHQKPDNCFCIRSVPPDNNLIENNNYVFALSYKKAGKISHIRIFKDKRYRLFVLDEKQTQKMLPSFKGIIELIVKSFHPIGDPRFKGLVSVTGSVLEIKLKNTTSNYVPYINH